MPLKVQVMKNASGERSKPRLPVSVVQAGGINVVRQTVVSGIVHEGGGGVVLILLRVVGHARDVACSGRSTKSW